MLLSFHIPPVSLMFNCPSVCFSVCIASLLSVHKFLFVSVQLVENYFQLFLSPTLELSRSYRCIFLPFSTSTLPHWPPTKGHSSLMYREVPDMLFPREKKFPCQLWTRAGVGDLLKPVQAAIAPGKLFKRLDLSLVAPYAVPLTLFQHPCHFGPASSHPWQVAGIHIPSPSPLTAGPWLYLVVKKPSFLWFPGWEPRGSRSSTTRAGLMGLLRQWQQWTFAEHFIFYQSSFSYVISFA